MRKLLTACLLLGALQSIAFAAPTAAEKHALVLSNSDYQGTERDLPNTANDAKLMADTLGKLGFKVTQASNLGRDSFYSQLESFSKSLPPGATALVYYAGHGMQIGGESYLMPIDMALSSEQKAPQRAYALKSMLDRLSTSASVVNIVILDACRNNPFQPAGVRYRSYSNLGLAKVVAPRGTFIAFATGPGQLAPDGAGKNSPYTAALARNLLEAGIDIETLFKKTGEQVRKVSSDDQIPWYNNSLAGDFFFIPPPGVTQVAGQPLPGNKNAQTGPYRNTEASAIQPWYRGLNEQEWSQLDWDIQQRVKHLTEDEIPLLEHKAKGGNVIAQTTLGLAWSEGIQKASGSQSNKSLRYGANNTNAIKWLTTAAEAGFPIAQTLLGEHYYQAKGVDRNLEQARKWTELGAEAKYPRAKLNLVQIKLEQGMTNPNDWKDAFGSMNKALQ